MNRLTDIANNFVQTHLWWPVQRSVDLSSGYDGGRPSSASGLLSRNVVYFFIRVVINWRFLEGSYLQWIWFPIVEMF